MILFFFHKIWDVQKNVVLLKQRIPPPFSLQDSGPEWNVYLNMKYPKQLITLALKNWTTLLLLLSLLTACTSTTPKDKYDLTGVWMRAKEILPNGEVINYPDELGQSFYKVYSDDGTYYFAYMRSRGGTDALYPEGKTTWEVKDGRYIESGITMDAHIHSIDSMTVRWKGHTETWRRLSDKERDYIVENSHAEQIRQAEAMEDFLLALSEKKYAGRMKALWWAIAALGMIALAFWAYAHLMRRKKKAIELRLHEIEERNQMMPKKMADARAEVVADFFNSNYYVQLKQRMEHDNNLAPNDWKMMEDQLRPVYPDFVPTLRSLHISETEYRVSLLLKLRIPLKDISTVMHKDAATISTIRSRLYHKVFQKKGGSRDWDDFIASL